MTTTPNRMMSYSGDVRCIGEWRFEGGGFVSVMVGGEVPTELAMQYVEKMMEIKKAELAKMQAAEPAS